MFCKQQMFLYKSFMSLAISAAVSSLERCISWSARSLKVALKRPHVNLRPPAWGPAAGRREAGWGAPLLFGGFLGLAQSGGWALSQRGTPWPPEVGHLQGDVTFPGEEAKGPASGPSHGQLGPQPVPGVGFCRDRCPQARGPHSWKLVSRFL